MSFSLQARFPPSQPAIFKHLASDALLRVRLFDGEPSSLPCMSAGRLKPKRLLGEMTFSVSHIEVTLSLTLPLHICTLKANRPNQRHQPFTVACTCSFGHCSTPESVPVSAPLVGDATEENNCCGALCYEREQS